MTRFATIAVFSASMGLAACSKRADAPAGPPSPHLVVVENEHEVRREGDFYRAEIRFRYTNRSGDTLVLTGCELPRPPALEWWNGEEWQRALGDQFEPGCLDPPFEIPPSTIIDDTLRVLVNRDSIDSGGRRVGPYWQASHSSGKYRLMWSLQDQGPTEERRHNFGGALRPLEERISNTFRLKIAGR